LRALLQRDKHVLFRSVRDDWSSVGADYFAIIGCPLQARLGADQFEFSVKCEAQATALERFREEIERDTGRPLDEATVALGPAGGPARETSFADLKRIAKEVTGGIPECASCKVGGNEPLGCYRTVTYPLDASFERAIFEYFLDVMENPPEALVNATDDEGRALTPVRLLYENIVAGVPDKETPWHVDRGRADQSGLAERSAPIRRKLKDGTPLDSARVLAGAFQPMDDALVLELYAHFFQGLFQYLEARAEVPDSPTLSEVRALSEFLIRCVEYDQHGGPVEMHVEV
jgi:hypothetical protein